MTAILVDLVHIESTPQDIDAAYAAEVNWAHGFRLNPDCRLMLVGVTRLIERCGEPDKQRTALVLGSHFGSLSSYEAFYDSLEAKKAQPLPYTHALPSTPAAAVSIRFGLVGPTLTVSGESEVGVTALRSALLLLERNRCDMAITGCWHAPSATTRAAGLPERSELLLLALRRDPAGAAPRWLPDVAADGRTCVAQLASWLATDGGFLRRRAGAAVIEREVDGVTV